MIMESKRTVVKVGTSSLTYENGKINYRRIESLCKVLSDLQNRGEQIMLVSSGAIGVGMGKAGLAARPTETKKKQALAAIGQCELMFMYDKLFGEYNHSVAQILLTRYAVETYQKKQNVINTIDELLSMNIIPIINENDTVAIDELEGKNFGDNDMLSAIVAGLVSADRLIILTDIDGLYTANPRTNPTAEKIDVVDDITDEIFSMAAGTGSNRGTGGMVTKLLAADYATKKGVEVYIINGSKPEDLYEIFDGNNIGTVFLAKEIEE
jgi:glutamate 5-kinase